jgi:azurin
MVLISFKRNIKIMSFFKISFLLISISISLLSGVANAGTCDVNIEATASMAFNVKEIAVSKTCKEITVNLKNTGAMAKAIMGHNLVITKTSDMQAVITDGMAAGLANNYVKQNDAKVIGHTAVIGGGESTSVKITLFNLKTTEKYSFFCSFPGHAAIMKGVFKLI